MLTVTVEKSGVVLTLRCRGRIVRGEETAILCAVIHQNAREINLDLSSVTAIDAAGVGALISLLAAGIYLRLLSPTPAVREVLRVTSVDSLLEICESELTSQPTEDTRLLELHAQPL